jgi:transposase-like protein
MVAEFPETMQQLFDQFSTEEDCLRYLGNVRWDGAFRCPSCAHTSAWSIRRGCLRCTRCRSDTSATEGTVFAHSRIPLTLWFLAVWCVVSQKQGVSALGLARALGIKRQKTGWQLLQKIRRGMIRPDRDRLSGLVEVDEILVGGKRHKREGRSPHAKTLVLVAAEDKGRQGIGRIRMRIIPDATAGSLHSATTAMVEPGSMVRTDGWTSYQPERWGYRHRMVKRQPLSPGDDPTPLIHRVSSLLKRWLLGTHQGGIQTTHLQEYLDEFVFRFNRRTSRSRGKLFYRLIQNLLHVSS